LIKKTDDWYKSWFSTQDYLELYKHRDNTDASKIVSLIFNHINLPEGSSVLDLACGNGRHSVLLAEKGMKVTGIDLSDYLISQACSKKLTDYKDFAENLSFEIRDMRDIDHENNFDMVVNLFSSFGYFEDDKENEKVINSISRSLRKGGYFVLDFLNKDYLENRLVPFDVKRTEGKIIVQVREVKNSFVYKHILIFKNSVEEYPALAQFTERIRLYTEENFRNMLAKNGLKVINVFGDFAGSKYDRNDSERLIIFSQKE
jgi:SAM-dependent methyltransferase